ncbi:MAG: polyphenol oxidase family protein [Clostridia bacterium]
MDLSNGNIIHIKTKMNEYIQFRKLLEYQDILVHAYSLGTDLNFRTSTIKKEKLPKEEYKKTIESYQLLCNSIDCNYINLVKTNQEHTDCVKIVDEKVNKDEPDFNLRKYYNTDGLITNQKDRILSTTNADCILLLFFDPIKKVVANTHSGWKGTLQRIAIKTVEKMIKEFGCNPKDIICCICPSIRKCHFEVEKDVKNMFEEEFRDLENLNKIIEEKVPSKKWNIDTVLINQIILEKQGLKKENIIDSGICSVCHSDLIHSYRVEKQGYGLNTALIGLK